MWARRQSVQSKRSGTLPLNIGGGLSVAVYHLVGLSVVALSVEEMASCSLIHRDVEVLLPLSSDDEVLNSELYDNKTIRSPDRGES